MRARLIAAAILLGARFCSVECEDKQPLEDPAAVSALLETVRSSSDRDELLRAWEALKPLLTPKELPDVLTLIEGSESLDDPDLLSMAETAVAECLERQNNEDALLSFVIERRTNLSDKAKMRILRLLGKVDTHRTRELAFSFANNVDADMTCAALAAVEYWDSDKHAVITTYLQSGNSTLKKGAALALGRAKAEEALPLLAEMLDSNDTGEAANALWAVSQISGQNLPNVAAAKSWWQTEKKESENNLAVFNELLKSADEGQLPVAIGDFSSLVLQREKAIKLLLPLLDHSEARVRAAACEALGGTNHAPQVIGKLIERLGDISPLVSTTAWRALKKLSDKPFPKKQAEWSRWFNRHRPM